MTPVTPDAEIPPICFLEDVAGAWGTSVRTLKRLRRAGAMPIEELAAIDKRPRYSGADVKGYRDNSLGMGRSVRLRRAS